MPFAADTPAQVRLKIRQGQIQGPTAGLCPGFAQANLVVLPQALAYDFLLFAQRNPRACPLLEVSDTGSRPARTSPQTCPNTAFTSTARWCANAPTYLRSGETIW